MAAVGLVAALAAAVLVADEARLSSKAWLAGRLIDRALAAHLRDGASHRPWPWADTYPVGDLQVERLGLRRVVLDGATGATLAFGPGLLHGTGPLNGPGTAVVAGHRDGAFRFLGELRSGDRVRLETPDGERVWQVVSATRRDVDDASVLAPGPAPTLQLVTCWPIDGLGPPRGRWVVTLHPV